MRSYSYLINLLFFIVLMGGITSAQSDRIPFEHLSVDEGLSNFSVTSIAQDSVGFIWIGTEHGLNRYDGYSFKAYNHRPDDSNSISSNFVGRLHVDRRGTLWVGSSGGLDRFDRERDRFIHYKRDPANPNSLGSGVIGAILEDSRGALWLSTGVSGIDILDPSTNRIDHLRHEPGNPNSLSSDTVSMAWFDTEGSLWVSFEEGVDVYDPQSGRFRHFRLDSLGTPRGSPEERDVNSFAEDAQHLIWMGSFTGVSVFDPRLGKPVRGKFPHTQIRLVVNTLHFDRRGRMWMGTFGTGLYLLDPASGGMTGYQPTSGDPVSLSAERVTAILEDRTGVFWIGCWKGGINRYDPGKIKFGHIGSRNNDPKSLNDPTVWCFLEDHDGVLWVGTDGGGLNRRDPESGRFTYFRDAARREGEAPINAIIEDSRRRIWLGTGSGFKRFDRATGTFQKHRADDFRLRELSTMSEDQQGDIWFGTFRGVFGKLDPSNGQITFVEFPESLGVKQQSPGSISCVKVRKNGDVWIGAFGAGLFSYTPRTGEFRRFVHEPDDRHSLGGNLIYSIHEDDSGSLWVGTFAEGLNRYVDATGTFERFTTSDGLPDGFVKSVLSDKHGILWMGTNKGLARFDPKSKSFRGFGVADGLQANEFRTGSCGVDSRGLMYFGGVNGYNVFHPDSIRPNPTVPPVVISDIKVHNHSVPLSNELHLKYDENVLSIDFVALNFTNPSRNQYAYMMTGVDKDWIYCGTRRNTNYSNLDAGEYVFRVKGSNGDGVWNEAGSSVTFIITPPYWNTWWFRISAVFLAFVSAAWTIRSIEMRKIRERMRVLEQDAALERERTRIARDMHDDIGARLTEMRLLSELSRRELHDPSAMKSNLDEISSAARSIVDSFQEIVWSVNPKNDTLDNFADYLTQYVHGYLVKAGLQCRLDIPAVLPAVRMPADIRHNMMMVVKELLNNTVKHAGAHKVDLSLSLADPSLSVVIQDDGKGFSPESVRHFGNGLTNMRRRVESIGGHIQIDAKPHGGTKVTLTVVMAGLKK